MRGGVAVMLGLFALAAAIAFYGAAGRYEIVATSGTAFRVDRLTGEVCIYGLGGSFLKCAR